MSLVYELFELLSGTLVAFVDGGTLGVLRYDGATRVWTFHATGTIHWDDLHQQVYRNHRATRLPDDYCIRNKLPEPHLGQYPNAFPVEWQANFESSLPLNNVPSMIRKRLNKNANIAYVVLKEDLYETTLGDGKYLYGEAAFWSETNAQKFCVARKCQDYSYTIKPVKLRMSGYQLEAELNLEMFEHLTVEGLIDLLVACETNPAL